MVILQSVLPFNWCDETSLNVFWLWRLCFFLLLLPKHWSHELYCHVTWQLSHTHSPLQTPPLPPPIRVLPTASGQPLPPPPCPAPCPCFLPPGQIHHHRGDAPARQQEAFPIHQQSSQMSTPEERERDVSRDTVIYEIFVGKNFHPAKIFY